MKISRFRALLATLLFALLLPTLSVAHDFEVGGIYYNIDGDNAIVTYKGNSSDEYSNEYTGNVNIPNTVSYNGNTYSVTSIGSSALSGCTGLTQVTIPNSVNSIGDYAFFGCGLTDVSIGESVTSIGLRAFQGCRSLTEVTIPSSVTSVDDYAFWCCTGLTDINIQNSTIGSYMFQGCTELTEVTIPNSVNSIGYSAFYGCTGLTSVNIQNSVIGNYMFRHCTGLTEITISNSVTSIGDYAFADCTGLNNINIQNSVIGNYMFKDCTGLTEVTIASSVTSIGDYAFADCTGLTEITIPSSVTAIGGGAFLRCTGLTEITIPNSVNSIGDYVFADCTGLTEITIPSSVTAIGGGAFLRCTGLTQVTISNSVTSVGHSAFDDCTGLTEIAIPNSVTSIGSAAFGGCTGLSEITIPNSVTSIGDYAFADCTGLTNINIQNSVIGNCMFWGCTGLTQVTIPNSVTSIGSATFYGCTGLTSVNIQNSIIGSSMFQGCTGLTEVTIPSSVTSVLNNAFSGCTGLTKVSIGESVTSIGNYAFKDCGGLESVICRALEPPSLGSNAFYGVPSSMCVYVYPIAIDAYKSASGWSQYLILPIDDGHVLSVSLPENVNVQEYANMRLEVTNTESGKVQHYTLTDKSSYKFIVEPNSTWNVTLTNQYGDLFGKIENVVVGEENIAVVFPSLLKPHDVSLIVKKPNGQDVTALCKISWFNEDGELLLQGNPIKKLPAGRKLKYQVSLPQDLATAYTLPLTNIYTVKEGNNDITCQLSAIGEAQLSGKVKDATNNQSLYGATISAVQSFGSGTTQTITARTDNQGLYSLEASTVPTTLTIAASGYISQTIDCDMASGDSIVTIPDVALSPITGAVINLNLTYTPAHAEGETTETQNWYSDYNNVDYEVYNKTKKRAISDIHVQYPQIVLMENVNDRDVLELTATSRKNAFMPVKTTVTIAEQKATATFNIKELGKVIATFNRNINPKVTGSLYDADNKLLKAVDYSGSTQTIEELPDGNYTLVTMGKSDFFNSIYDLDEFAAAGLTEGDDYVKNEVQVNSGIISLVSIDKVPFFDESKFYYTGEHTSFSVNKLDIVIGNYLTFRALLDFKEQYANLVNDVQLIINLPESCSFIDNSVMAGANMAVYSTSGNRITVPLQNWNDVVVRFCAIPTLPGDFAPSAFVRFELNGKTITQPIGNANFHVESISSLIIPPRSASTMISVGGTALSNCQIDIYDNDVLIGHTTSMANSKWLTTCELYKPYNLSRHNIYAIITTDQGFQVPTETATCIYDKNEPQVSKVTQYNEQRGPTPYIVIWDFLNPSLSSQHYSYDMSNNHRTFSYTIEFTDNQAVDNVMLYVKTAKGHWWPLEATYDSDKDVWVTAGEFGDSQNADLPVNVAVDYDSYGESELDMSPVDDLVYDLQQTAEKEDSLFNDASELMDSLLVNYENGILSADELLERLDSIFVTLYLIDVERPDDEPFDPENDDNEERHNPSPEFENLEAQLQEPINQTIPSSSSGGWYIPPVSVTTIEPIVDENEDIHLMDGQWWADLPNSTSVTFYDGQGGRITTDMNDAIGYPENTDEAYEAWAEDLIDFMGDVFDYSNLSLSIATDIAKNELDKFERQIRIDRKLIWYDIAHNPQPHAQPINELARHFDDVNRDAEVLRRARNVTRIAKGVSTVIGGAGSAIDVVKFVGGVRDGINWNKKWKNLIEEIQQCKDPEAQSVANEAKEYQNWARSRSIRTGVLKGAGTTLGIVGTVAAPETLGASLFLNVGGFVVNQVADHWKKECKKTNNENWKTIQNKYSQLDCDGDPITGGSPTGGAAPISEPNGHKYPGADMNFCIDPSGFVYEGVPSNRLQGVTATCYYKETVEDMYGDSIENVVLWDAENYGQENPLITDENGYYRWDVPIGMWQVKYEKEGYETTYSDWLPVPPPQLDVNIGMVQMRQPEVIKARAYPKAVEFEFDKFMSPETLNSDNITVTVNGSPVSGTIELLNAELDDPLAITSIRRAPGTGLTFASKVRFNANSPFNADKVTLHVKKDVKSYADLEMYEDYEAVLDVELEIQSIEADSTVNILYGDSRELTVTVLPANASMGKTLSVRSVAPMITTTDAETYTLNNNGQAIITLHGDLPGSTSLLYSIEDYDLTASTLVKVMMESQMTVATPTASIANGSVVPSGTAVYLRCATEGATIYYTLDGSCPCDNTPARKVYDGTPIIINGTTIIKAMATAPDLYDSNVATYVYHVGNGLRGDVNGDGEVNIADVNAVIDIILGGNVDDDTRARADVNEDGEINIADINVIIDIILNPSLLMSHKVNCDDKLRLENVNIKPGEVRTLQVNVDHASRYSAMQCDIVVPAGLTLIGTNATGSNVSKMGSIDERSSRALSYSPTKVPFASNGQSILTLTVRADEALEAESEIVLTNVVLADAENKAWHLADCIARVNNTSGINDLTAVADKVWVEGHTLFIESRQEGTAQLATINGIVCDIPVKAGVNQHRLDQGIYIVVINGVSHKIAIK